MKRIVVGLDGSAHQDNVLRGALEFPEGRLTLVRAVSLPVELPPKVFAVAPSEVAPIIEEAAKSDLARMAKTVPAERLEAVLVELGTPWRTLTEVAKRVAADLIVVGSHGYGALDHLLGTTAAKVVNHAPCSVLVVGTGSTRKS
jgi:nucleotide-binding universal stress UspA family protein